jgi:hypothetical protein
MMRSREPAKRSSRCTTIGWGNDQLPCDHLLFAVDIDWMKDFWALEILDLALKKPILSRIIAVLWYKRWSTC